MTLLGTGVLVNHHDVAPAARTEFEAWHTHEHVPERVAVPGFLRGRRYRAVEGTPEYYILYETRDPQVLGSRAYHERLDHPTPWTSRMSAAMTYTGRNAGRVACSLGDGAIGGVAITLRVAAQPVSDSAGVDPALERTLASLGECHGITALHLFESDPALSRLDTSEARIRQAQGADGFDHWIAVVEGLDGDRLAPAREALAPWFADSARAPLYRLQVLLAARAA